MKQGKTFQVKKTFHTELNKKLASEETLAY